MSEELSPLDPSGVRSYSLQDRPSKVTIGDFARPAEGVADLGEFLDSLPRILAAQDLRRLVATWLEARSRGRPVLLGMGAHVIKVGLGPQIIRWMETGRIQGVALNGAGMIHDFEVAFAGQTSEDVAAVLGDGTFGMARETAEELNGAARDAQEKGIGLGRAAGERILSLGRAHEDFSILAAGARLSVPVTVHVAVGTDIVHMHPSADGAAIGAATHTDFLLFARLVSGLARGLYLNIGSAVLLPEVFLKALSLARNLGHAVDGLTTCNMDFIRHYRPSENVVRRPVMEGDGWGFHLVGHHEIMIPLLAGLLEAEATRRG